VNIVFSPRFRRALSLAFFLSGCSGLIYQTVWVRMLTRYLGATTYATATVLTVFMAGLALGSYLGGRYADRTRRPLIGYLLLEIAIAASGLLASFVLIQGLSTYYLEFYDVLGARSVGLLATQVVFAGACLLPASMLMGATLPVLVALVGRLGEELQAGLAQLYAVNTLGAAAGTLAAGLVLIGELGERASLGLAASLNLAAGLLVLGLRKPQPGLGDKRPEVSSRASETAPFNSDPLVYSPLVRRLALVVFMVSGFSALAYEVLWTRLLVLVLHTSIYAFSTMLGTFLAGIALGSRVIRSSRWRQAPAAAFGLLEMCLGFWALAGLVLLPLGNDLWMAADAWSQFTSVQMAVGILVCVVIVFPMGLMFGMQFPLAVRSCLKEADAPGRTAGTAYAANTLGTILGAVSAGFILIPVLGTARSMVLVAALNLVFGLLLLPAAPRVERNRRLLPAVGLTAVFAIGAFWVGDPYQAIMLARTKKRGPEWAIFRSYERAAATTMVAGVPGPPPSRGSRPPTRALLVNGISMSILCTEAKIMAHLPYLLADNPQSMLVICFGMGTTYRSACQHPGLRVDAIDIVPEVYDCFGDVHADAERWLNRPNAYRHVGDGRNHLLVHPDGYDVITIDPAPPLYSAGTVNLYTREFLELCKERLTPGGVCCLWVPPGPESEIQFVLSSFLDVFPDMTLWGGLEFPGFYLVGSRQPLALTASRLAQLAEQLGRIEDMGEWRRNVDYTRPENLKALYLTDAAGVARLVNGVRPMTDDHPYTEFPLWRYLCRREGRRHFDANEVRRRFQ
jgi:spermidine synthase